MSERAVLFSELRRDLLPSFRGMLLFAATATVVMFALCYLGELLHFFGEHPAQCPRVDWHR